MAGEKNFAVIGLGTFGYQAAAALYEGGAPVLAIDVDKDIVQRIRNDVTQAICGDGTDEEVLRATGILEVDVVVVAIRNHFETTVHITHMLKNHGVKELYVQVNNEREASAIMALGATQAIFPEFDMARRFARQLLYSNLTDLLPLGPNLGIIDVPIPANYLGKTLIDLEIRKNYKISVVAVRRKAKQRLRHREVVLEPTPDEPLEEGDVLVVLGNVERLSRYRNAVTEGK